MFGYLNLNDPTKIGNTESQEAINLRLDRGYLEYQSWPIDTTIMRSGKDPQGNVIRVDPSVPIGFIGVLQRVLTGGNDIIGLRYPPNNIGWNYGVKPVLYDTSVGPGPFYPAKEYNYAITLFDPVAGEESRPFFVTAYTDGTYQLGFKDFPGMGSNYPLKEDLEWRIYRRPLGSAEYLQLPHPTIQAVTDNATSYLDTFNDSALTLPLNTVDVYDPYDISSSSVNLFAIHNGRLWLPRPFVSTGADQREPGHLLFFSKQNIFGEFPFNNYFSFNSPIQALWSIDETLYIITEEGPYALYGNDESDFVLKEISNTGVGGAWVGGSAAVGNQIIFISTEKTERAVGKSIHSIFGNAFNLISEKINKMFPVVYPTTINAHGSGVVDNRFLVLGYGEPTTGGAYLLRRLVFDTVTGGFLIGNPATTEFSYKSKEFGSPGWWVGARRMFVRGLGNFTVELYGDGVKIDEIAFSISGTIPQTEDFTVPPYRCNYFSYRFIGQSNSKIYEFGRKE
ncbi:MAG TPA: hypothetical protein PKN29_10905 [Candidatus Ozemobacteraceae bacterium]|nr:hypothetical protein [Candidatus Ozemobacteraceae bacterium]